MKPYGTHRGGIGWNPYGLYCGECSEKNCLGCVNARLKQFEISGTLVQRNDDYQIINPMTVESISEYAAIKFVERSFKGVLRDIKIKQLTK